MKNLWNKFTDSFGRTIIHPQFIMLSLTHQAIAEAKKYSKGKLVDIGCGRMPYRKELEPLVDSYTGIDHPKISKLYKGDKKPEILSDATSIPVKSQTFSIALMLQVLEYLEDPDVAIREARRILKKEGILVLSSPFLYPIHDAPYDRNRFTNTQIRTLLTSNGFKILKMRTQGGFLDFWIQSLLVYLFKNTQDLMKKTPALVLLASPLILVLLFITIFLNSLVVAFRPIQNLFPTNKDFPLDYLVVAKKK